MSYWHTKSAQVIQATIQRVGRDDPAALRKALTEAYPFGERRMWPYKVWCAAVKKALAGTDAARPGRPKDGPAPGPSLFPEGL